MMIPEGNFDSEGFGGSQQFADTPGSGNIQSDIAPLNAARSGGMDYYLKLGQQLMQAMNPQQQPMIGADEDAPSTNPYDTGSLTGGFNQNWLAERISAGSANGAKIGGMLGK